MKDGGGEHLPRASNDNDRVDEEQTGAGASGKKCMICRKPALHKYRPFCSRRCADVDLGRWFSGTYAIPAVESEDDQSGIIDPADET